MHGGPSTRLHLKLTTFRVAQFIELAKLEKFILPKLDETM